jgi:hypothetical protein
VLGYLSVRDEANIKLVKLVGEHPIVYDWTNAGSSRKGEKSDLVR